MAQELGAQLGRAHQDADLVRIGQGVELLACLAQANNISKVELVQDHEEDLGREVEEMAGSGLVLFMIVMIQLQVRGMMVGFGSSAGSVLPCQ